MILRLSDVEIRELIDERKPLPDDYRQRIQPKLKLGHKERELDIIGASKSEFRIVFRQSQINPIDFSIILAYCVPKTNQIFRLRRYNGKSHEHTNPLEGNSFYSFHIHMATERYQDSGLREDSYAEPSNRFADYHGAIRCLFEDCSFEQPPGLQSHLFGEEV